MFIYSVYSLLPIYRVHRKYEAFEKVITVLLMEGHMVKITI